MAIKPLSFARDRELIFHRRQLAEDLINRLSDPVYKSGLFLSAPRRTGKTTFIRADLLPMLREAGAVVIYADLWEQRSINPAKVIISALRDAIVQESGVLLKASLAMGLKKVKIGGLEMDLDAIGTREGDSIARTLEKLGAASDKPIVMVVDEAQHAQTTEEGRDTLFALKAARDGMIMGEGKGFRFIATGSKQRPPQDAGVVQGPGVLRSAGGASARASRRLPRMGAEQFAVQGEPFACGTPAGFRDVQPAGRSTSRACSNPWRKPPILMAQPLTTCLSKGSPQAWSGLA